MRKLFESWNSYLLEIMDNPAETNVGIDDPFERIVFFEVGDKEYEITFGRETISSIEWSVEFSIQNVSGTGYDMQNIKDIRLTSIVFATVLQEIKKFLSSRGDELVLLSMDADRKEPSRVRFYDFLMKRFSPKLREDGFVTGAMDTDSYRTNIIFNPDYLNNQSLTKLQRSDLMFIINNLTSGQEEVKKAFFNAGLRGL